MKYLITIVLLIVYLFFPISCNIEPDRTVEGATDTIYIFIEGGTDTIIVNQEDRIELKWIGHIRGCFSELYHLVGYWETSTEWDTCNGFHEYECVSIKIYLSTVLEPSLYRFITYRLVSDSTVTRAKHFTTIYDIWVWEEL